MSHAREHTTYHEAVAGCLVCGDKAWTGRYAQAQAARHHDSSAHTTWCHVIMTVRYGDDIPKQEPA